MSTALLVMTDGRKELLQRTLESFAANVVGDLSMVLINDDSADPAYYEWLYDHGKDYFPPKTFVLAHGTQERSGFGGAIRSAWTALNALRENIPFDWVFHLEDDFLFLGTVYLDVIQRIMTEYPYLAQMALKRQPWGSDLPYANGFMEAQPDWYTEKEDKVTWVETRRNWTTNPALFRADLLAGGWPEDPYSEGKYGFVLKEHGLPWGVEGNDVQFGIWGHINDPPRVLHIGDYRVGDRY